MSRAAGVKKPSGSQKTRALLKIKLPRTVERNTVIQIAKTHLKDPIVALDKALKCVENQCWRVFPQCPALVSFKVCGRSRSGRAFGPTWIRWIVCVCVFTHSIHGVECAREVRAAWRALFLPDSEGADIDAGQ